MIYRYQLEDLRSLIRVGAAIENGFYQAEFLFGTPQRWRDHVFGQLHLADFLERYTLAEATAAEWCQALLELDS